MDPYLYQGHKTFNELYYRCQEIAYLIHQTPHGGLNYSKPPLDFSAFRVTYSSISLLYEKVCAV